MSGKLTAEQVRDVWGSNLKRDCLYDPPSPDWQAIVDELNAAMGSSMAEGRCGMTEYIGYLDEDHAPVVDMAQEVVRCRDCKHFFPYFTRNDPETPHFCELHGSDWVWPDGYCSGGERRDA